ncbi:MAG: hypothetical protein NUV85_02550 [Candidatus Berkelbacteria bacterium]|nr:hypothetical protein [Candidatus Berkelbacteria bacterium]
MKKITFLKVVFLALVISILFSSNTYAADGSDKLPTRWTYAHEWVNLNIFTWKSDSKVIVLDKTATTRARNIEAAYKLGETDQVAKLTNRYVTLKNGINLIIEKKKPGDANSLVEKIQTSALEQQKILSKVRQSTEAQDQQETIASTQETTANQTKDDIVSIKDQETADIFADKIVAIWRDPENNTQDEKTTRVYAPGTQESGDLNDGVIIDGGEAKISQDTTGDLKIEYAPGTGPSSVTTGEGKKVWKIQMSDGQVVESYSAASNVVIGQADGVAGNIVVNTVSGGTGSEKKVVAGGSGGTGTVVVEGGKKNVVTSDDGPGSVNVEGNP